jgi:hypothetical protein
LAAQQSKLKPANGTSFKRKMTVQQKIDEADRKAATAKSGA